MASTSSDPIVSEFDIVLGDGDDLLYHVQFPTRPHITKFVPDRARYRMQVNQLELTVATDLQSTCFSRSQADHIAGKCANDAAKKQVTRQTYTGSASNGLATRQRCAIGRLVDGRLHLSPITATLQMRPSLAHLDKVKGKGGEAAQRKDKDGFVVSDDSDDEEKEKEPAAAAIRVKFAREIENSGIKRRETLLEKRRRLDDTDPWVTLDVKGGDRGVPTVGTGDTTVFDTVPLQQVLRSVCPPPDDAVYVTASTNDWSSLRSLPLIDQVRLVMSRVHTIKFAQIRTLLPPGATSEEIITALKVCSTLIHGCWTCRSSVLFPEGGTMPIEQCRAMQRARDYVLYQFILGESVTRKAIGESCHIVCDDALHDAIRMVGIYKSRSYVFKLTHDTTFIQEHPSLIEWSTDWWKSRWDILQMWMKEYDANMKTEVKPPPTRRRRLSSRANHDQAPTVVKVENGDEGKSNGTVEMTELTKFVYGVMSECPVRTIGEVRALIAVHAAEAKPPSAELSNVTDTRIVAALTAVHAVHVVVKDKGRQGDNATYALTTGRTHPATRRALTHFIKTKASFRLKTFLSSLPPGGEHPTDEDEIKSLVDEFCTNKAGIYHLRGECTK